MDVLKQQRFSTYFRNCKPYFSFDNMEVTSMLRSLISLIKEFLTKCFLIKNSF